MHIQLFNIIKKQAENREWDGRIYRNSIILKWNRLSHGMHRLAWKQGKKKSSRYNFWADDDSGFFKRTGCFLLLILHHSLALCGAYKLLYYLVSYLFSSFIQLCHSNSKNFVVQGLDSTGLVFFFHFFLA